MSARTQVLATCFRRVVTSTKGFFVRRDKTPNHLLFRLAKIVPQLNEISEILPDQLYLSGCLPVTRDTLQRMKITLVVRAMTEAEEQRLNVWTRNCTECKNGKKPTCAMHTTMRAVRILDNDVSNAGLHFEKVASEIREELENGGRVLVHCVAGVSRSCTLILAYLIRYENLDLLEAAELVARKRDIIRPNDGFLKQLVDYERSLATAERGKKKVHSSSKRLDLLQQILMDANVKCEKMTAGREQEIHEIFEQQNYTPAALF